jgi:hypothetical protein
LLVVHHGVHTMMNKEEKSRPHPFVSACITPENEDQQIGACTQRESADTTCERAQGSKIGLDACLDRRNSQNDG